MGGDGHGAPKYPLQVPHKLHYFVDSFRVVIVSANQDSQVVEGNPIWFVRRAALYYPIAKARVCQVHNDLPLTEIELGVQVEIVICFTTSKHRSKFVLHIAGIVFKVESQRLERTKDFESQVGFISACTRQRHVVEKSGFPVPAAPSQGSEIT
jgi:hypothetical protein